MKVKTLFFGAIGEIVGMRESEIEISDGTTAGDVLAEYEERHAALRGKRILIAIDEVHSDKSVVLEDGQHVAFFTAVSGG